jgi:hypothetical protein
MKSITFGKGNRSGNKLHIELPGCTVNITIGLTDRIGREVTSVRISPDDESRGGDGYGYCWRQVDATRIIRDLLPGLHSSPSVTAERCRHCGAHIEQGDDHLWANLSDVWENGEPDPNLDEADRLACPEAPRRDSDLRVGLHEPALFTQGDVIEYVSRRTGPDENSGTWVPGTFDYHIEDSPKHVYVRPLSRPHGPVLALRSEIRQVPAELVSAARSWTADCTWREEADDIADLTDVQIVAGVEAYFEGGWAAFAAAETEPDDDPAANYEHGY